MSAPRVSVVTIFFQAERFLEEAIQSVLAQTFPDWELILVDDGSTDGGSAIAQCYAEQDPRIRVVTHPDRENRGMSASRNLGVAEGTGELVAFLDADDTWFPPKLEEQVALADAHPDVGMLYGRTEWWYGWTGEPADLARDYLHDPGVLLGTVIPAPTLLEALVADGLVPPYTCSMLVRREAFERLGGFEEAFRGLYEDQVFFAKVFLNEAVYVADRCWDRYRQHDGSACAVAYASFETHPVDINPARGAFLEWLSSYLSRERPGDRTLWGAVNEALRPYRHPTAWWDITAVEQRTADADEADALDGGYIDAPIAGQRTGGDVVHVLGWAIGADSPVIAVELLHEGQVVRREQVGDRRPDLLVAFPNAPEAERAGFHVQIVPVGTVELDLEVRAVLRDQRRVRLGRIRGRRRLRDTDRALATPLVSVVIAAGGNAAGLIDTVDSALDQTYGYTEAVVVDCGLGDEDRRLLGRYAGLRIVESPNGAGAARTAGAAASAGSLVAFAEPGERLHRDALETAVSRLSADPELRWASSGAETSSPPEAGAVAVFHRHALAGVAEQEESSRPDGRPAAPRSVVRLAERASSALVLLYHRTADLPSDPWGLAVSPEHFAQHVEVLRKTCALISLPELVGSLGSAHLPRRAVAVTFDDGYKDNLEVAAPLLEQQRIPATVFIATEALGRERGLWWDELQGLVLTPGKLPDELELELDGAARTWKLGSAATYTNEAVAAHRDWRAWQEPPTERHALFADLYRLLRPQQPSVKAAVLARLRELAGEGSARPADELLSEPELLELAGAAGIEIGAHTVTHPRLADLSPEDQRYEIEESKRRLEEILRHPVTSFAYPHGSRGDYSAETSAIVASAGFASACVAHGGLVAPATSRFAIPRVPVVDCSGEELARKLELWFSS
ncbi:MAG: hypothetical protein QOE29_1207 [Gaiellaceae bacterium]|nr:hypothetical protein [Gaiellaceae bacterium]